MPPLDKAHQTETHANIILNAGSPKCLRIETRMSKLSPILFNFVLEVLAWTFRQENKIKCIWVRNGKVKLYLQMTQFCI